MAESVPALLPLALEPWVAAHKHLLVPPVCNKLVYGEGSWKVMVVGGPNERADYHIEEGEEFFFQLRGDMCLKVVEQGAPRDIAIREGQMLMLPARVPHSPNRYADTAGLVMERARRPGELDGLRYYTADFAAVLYEEWFHCADLGKDLKPVIDRFHASDAKRTGVPARAYPPPPVEVDETSAVGKPVDFAAWVAEVRGEPGAPAACVGRPLFAPRGSTAEFAVDAYWGACAAPARARTGEVVLVQHAGCATVRVTQASGGGESALDLRAGEIVLVPEGCAYELAGKGADCVGLELYLTHWLTSTVQHRHAE